MPGYGGYNQNRNNRGRQNNYGGTRKNENYQLSKVEFVNPYTFVPCDKNKRKYEDGESYYEGSDLKSGVLHCKLHVKAPFALSVLKQERPDAKNGTSYEISGEECVIPGSSLRGEIRSVFEAATNSCFSTMRDETILTKREMPKNAYKPAILKKVGNKYVLYSAKRHLLTCDRNSDFAVEIQGKQRCVKDKRTGKIYKTGAQVSFNNKIVEIRPNVKFSYVTSVGGGKNKGYVLVGEYISNKKHESIFTISREETRLSQEDIKQAYEQFQKS